MGNCCSILEENNDSQMKFGVHVIAVADMGHGGLESCKRHEEKEGANLRNTIRRNQGSAASLVATSEKRWWFLSYRNVIYVALICIVVGAIQRFYHKPSSLDAMLMESSLPAFTAHDGKKINDHVYIDLDKLSLTPKQRELINDVYQSPKLHTRQIQEEAAAVGVKISPHLVYRYFRSSEWGKGANIPKFYGKNFEDAIIETIRFRREYNIARIDPKWLAPIVKSKLMYTNGYDKHDRPILYVKFLEVVTKVASEMKNEDYLKTVLLTALHSVEKADRLSTMKGSGEFLVIVDLNGLSWKTCPPIKTMGQVIGFLKRHFPYRLHAIYIINVGIIFDTIWSFIKPMVPPRALRKTIFLKKDENSKLLLQNIGSGLEFTYGGKTAIPKYEDDRVFVPYATT